MKVMSFNAEAVEALLYSAIHCTCLIPIVSLRGDGGVFAVYRSASLRSCARHLPSPSTYVLNSGVPQALSRSTEPKHFPGEGLPQKRCVAVYWDSVPYSKHFNN